MTHRMLICLALLVASMASAFSAPAAAAQEVEGSLSCSLVIDGVLGYIQERSLLLDAKDGDLFDEDWGSAEFAGNAICTGADATDAEDPWIVTPRTTNLHVYGGYTYVTCGAGHWSGEVRISGGWPNLDVTASVEMEIANGIAQAEISDVEGYTPAGSVAGGEGSAAFHLREFDPGAHCESESAVWWWFTANGGLSFTFHD